MRRTGPGCVITALTIVTEWFVLLHASSAADIAPSGMFVGGDPRFSFVLQVREHEQAPGVYFVRGLGKLRLSQAIRPR